MLSTGHAAVRRLVAASLAHLASAFRLDGFCFLNAESLTHGAGLRADLAPHACHVCDLFFRIWVCLHASWQRRQPVRHGS